MNKYLYRGYKTGQKEVEIELPGNLLINRVKDKTLREKSAVMILEDLVNTTDITILADNSRELLNIIDFLENQPPGRFYFNAFTPFNNDLLPVNLNESFDFLSIYKKNIVFETLYYVIFEGSKKVARDDFFAILESIVSLHGVSDVWGILDKLSLHRHMRDYINQNIEGIDFLKSLFSQKATLYDIMEDAFSNKESYPFLLFSLEAGNKTAGLFIHLLLVCLDILLTRRWVDKDMRINIVFSISQSELLEYILSKEIFTKAGVLFYLINPDINVPENIPRASISEQTKGTKPVIAIDTGSEKRELILREPSSVSGRDFNKDNTDEYFKKKKRIKKTSSFVIYKNENTAKGKKSRAKSREHAGAGSIQTYFHKSCQRPYIENLYPYLGAVINCEYKKNPANMMISRRLRLLFLLHVSQGTLRIEYFDTYKKENLVEKMNVKANLRPVKVDLCKSDIIQRVKNEIKQFVSENESIQLFYNKHMALFSEYQQSYGDFLNRIKKTVLGKYDIQGLKEKYLEKWFLLRDKIQQEYSAISIKDMLENHYIRHFLFSKETEYPDNLTQSSASMSLIENGKLRYSVRGFEEELLERLIILKDKMDRIIEDTISYPVKPGTEDIMIEDLNIIYLPFSYPGLKNE